MAATYDIRLVNAEDLQAAGMLLFAPHAQEVGGAVAMRPVRPQTAVYHAMERAGVLLALASFDSAGELVGYSVNIVLPSLHDGETLVCTNDAFYVSPEHRKGLCPLGLRLMDATEEAARMRGCAEVHWQARPMSPLAGILERRGCLVDQLVFVKAI